MKICNNYCILLYINRNFPLLFRIERHPYLELMDSNGLLVYADDDSGATFPNAKINFYSNAGEVWYIVASEYDSEYINEYDLLIN